METNVICIHLCFLLITGDKERQFRPFAPSFYCRHKITAVGSWCVTENANAWRKVMLIPLRQIAPRNQKPTSQRQSQLFLSKTNFLSRCQKERGPTYCCSCLRWANFSYFVLDGCNNDILQVMCFNSALPGVSFKRCFYCQVIVFAK